MAGDCTPVGDVGVPNSCMPSSGVMGSSSGSSLGEVVPRSYRPRPQRLDPTTCAAVVAEQTPDYHLPTLGSSQTATPATPATPAAAGRSDAPVPTSPVAAGTSDAPVPTSPAAVGSSHAARANEAGLTEAVARVRRHLADRADLGRLEADALRRRLALLRRLEGATTAAIASTVAALDRAGGIEADGAPSKAEWLKANTGRSGREAARLQRLADNLDELPATADALASGDLTAEAADVIVRASRDGRIGPPEAAEAELLPVATTASPEDLRRHITRRQQAADGAALLRDESRQRALRRLSLTQRDDGGMWEVHGHLSNEVGSKLRTAFDAFDVSDPGETPIAQRRRPDQRLADALEAMVDTVLDGGMTPASGGIARPHLSVIVDLDTVAANLGRNRGDGPVPPDDPAWAGLTPGETSWGSLLSPQAIHRLLCDASVSRIVMAGRSQVLDVGRAHRDWTEPQRRAVNARDRGCRGPNCTRPIAWTSIHHIAWWHRDRGRTDVANGLALCTHCHHLVHDRGWTVTLDPDTAAASWTAPSGAVTVSRPHHLDPTEPTEPVSDRRSDRPPRPLLDGALPDGRGPDDPRSDGQGLEDPGPDEPRPDQLKLHHVRPDEPVPGGRALADTTSPARCLTPDVGRSPPRR